MNAQSVPSLGNVCVSTSTPAQRGHDTWRGNVTVAQVLHREPASASVSLVGEERGVHQRRTAHDVALTSSSTSAECSPSRGAGWGGTVDSVEKRYGAPGMRTVP